MPDKMPLCAHATAAVATLYAPHDRFLASRANGFSSRQTWAWCPCPAHHLPCASGDAHPLSTLCEAPVARQAAPVHPQCTCTVSSYPPTFAPHGPHVRWHHTTHLYSWRRHEPLRASHMLLMKKISHYPGFVAARARPATPVLLRSWRRCPDLLSCPSGEKRRTSKARPLSPDGTAQFTCHLPLLTHARSRTRTCALCMAAFYGVHNILWSHCVVGYACAASCIARV